LGKEKQGMSWDGEKLKTGLQTEKGRE